MSEKKLDERDFHHGEGHSIPLFIRLVWPTFLILGTIYLVRFMWPDLQLWLNK